MIQEDFSATRPNINDACGCMTAGGTALCTTRECCDRDVDCVVEGQYLQ